MIQINKRMKYACIIIVGFMIGGTIAALMFQPENSMVGEAYLEFKLNFAQKDISYGALFSYVLQNRLPLFLCFFFFRFSKYREKILDIILGVMAVSYSYFAVGIVSCYGAVELFLLLGLMFPQWICYILGSIGMIRLIPVRKIRIDGDYLLNAIFVFCMFLAGFLTETFLNPWIVKFILSFYKT